MTQKGTTDDRVSHSDASYAGVYREGSFRVALSGLGEGDCLEFRVVFACVEGASVERSERIHEARECEKDEVLFETFEENAPLKYFEVRLHDLVFPAHFTGKLFSVVPLLRGSPVKALENKWGLDSLLPMSEEECERCLWFISSRDRHPDPETLRYVADQVASFDMHIPLYLRCNARVLTLYKSIELLDKNRVNLYCSSAEMFLSECRGLRRAGSSKKDGLMLRASLATALWHAYILSGKYERAFKLIEEMAFFDYSSEKSPVFALNVAHAKMMLCIIVWMSGSDSESKWLWLASFREIFFDMAARPTSSRGWFSDYGNVHGMILGLWKAMLKNIDPHGVNDIPAHILERSVRVKSPEFLGCVASFVEECSGQGYLEMLPPVP